MPAESLLICCHDAKLTLLGPDSAGSLPDADASLSRKEPAASEGSLWGCSVAAVPPLPEDTRAPSSPAPPAPCVSSVVVLLLGAAPGMKKLGWLVLRLKDPGASSPDRPDTLPSSLPPMASLVASEAAGVGLKKDGGPLPGAAGMPGSLGPPMPGSRALGPGIAGLLPGVLPAPPAVGAIASVGVAT